jgi:protocatechuate 3,4-dioxygenase, alpha subunit
MTPWQTAGPFLHLGMGHLLCNDLAPEAEAAGMLVHLKGQVIDGAGAPVADGLIELWQVSASGGHFARVATDDEGRWSCRAIVPAADAPVRYIAVSLFARGILRRIATRIYFEDPIGDPQLAALPAARHATLIARPIADAHFRFDLVLQGGAHGRAETVFFEV